MSTSNKIYSMVLSALLVAVGIVIPMFMPIKVIIEPMSFTLASHVAIMIAMFISPSVACATAIGTTLGFFLAGFPLAVVLRAGSQIVWVIAGAIYLKKFPNTMSNPISNILFTLAIAIFHGILEVIVVLPLYLGTNTDILYVIFGLVGLGTIVHSVVDMIISDIVFIALSKIDGILEIASVKKMFHS